VGKDLCKIGVWAWLALLLFVFSSCENEAKKQEHIENEPTKAKAEKLQKDIDSLSVEISISENRYQELKKIYNSNGKMSWKSKTEFDDYQQMTLDRSALEAMKKHGFTMEQIKLDRESVKRYDSSLMNNFFESSNCMNNDIECLRKFIEDKKKK
jgi:hypothetical protein